MRTVSVRELTDWLADAGRPAPCLVDIREPWETALACLPGCVTLPMAELPIRQAELPDDQPIVVICHHGVRSHYAALWLEEAGFGDVASLQGGLDAWSAEIDPDLPRY